MKAVHIITGLDVGGAELMLRRLLLSQLQIDPSRQLLVVSLTSNGSVAVALNNMGIKTIALGINSPASGIRGILRLRSVLRNYKPDFVQTWMYHADLIGGLCAWMAGCKRVVWGVRSSDITKGGARSTIAVRWICALLSKYIPHTIVCAAEVSRRIHVGIGYDAKRMVVVSNGFDLNRLLVESGTREAVRYKFGILQQHFLVGCVGRFSLVKDFHNFVKAAGTVATASNSVYFFMVGRGLDSSNSELMGWIKMTGFAERFILIGERSDIPACLSAMDVYVLSSRTEGFPNALGEAMAMGLPCVSTNVGDAAYLLGNNGVVVPAEDSQALAQGILQVLNMTFEERYACGQSAKKRMYDKFSMQRCAQQFESVYESVLSSQR